MQALQLTEDQTAQHKKAFDLLDKNKDGDITTSELGAAMKSIGLSPSEAELQDMIKSVDADASGTLDFNEFQVMIVKQISKSKMEQIKEMFREYDSNNDGTITVDELRQLFQSDELKDEGFASDEIIIEKMFQEADINKDGRINIEGGIATS